MKKALSCILFFLLLVFYGFPLYSIELTAPDWEIVADGVSVCEPVKTSWGFVTITDGRTLIGWTVSGTKRFETKLNRKPSELLTADSSDFLWHVSYDRMYLSCFNTDGVLLWEKNLDTPCAAIPLVPGRDGRLFMALENTVLCVDINGNTVWNHAVSSSPVLSLYEKGDGSLVCNMKTVLSPFGEVLFEGDNIQVTGNLTDKGLIHTETCNFRINPNAHTSGITAYDFYGNELWSKSFAPDKVLYYEFTDDTVITLSENWVISGWKYSSVPSHPVVKNVLTDTLYEDSYGSSKAEKDYRSLVKNMRRIITIAGSKSINGQMRDVSRDMLYIKQAGSAGYDFSSLLSDIILKENDPGVLQTALNAAATLGRDPSGLIFDAVNARLEFPSFQYADGLYAAFIDAVHAITIHSGSEERASRAKKILTPLVTLFNRTLVQKHAASALQNIIALYPSSDAEVSF